MILDRKHRLDVDEGCAVDGFEGADLHPVARPLDYAHAVQADRIGPIRGSRREHATDRECRVAPGMQLQHIAPRLVKPSEDDDLLPNRDPIDPG